jgi:tetratricopeptide (TPR) repeat protein
MVLFLTVDFGFGQNAAMQILTKGVEHAAQGNFNKAKVEFEKVLIVDSDDESAKRVAKRGLKVIEDVTNQKIKSTAVIRLFKGLSYGFKGQWAEAIVEYDKAIEINPRYDWAYFSRGGIYVFKGQYDKAIADYNKAIEINPRYAEAYISRGGTYLTKRQYDKAIADYNKAIEINPRYGDAYFSRGGTYLTKRQYDRAITDYNKAIEINPRYAMAYFSRAVAYFYKKEYEEAWDDVYRAQNLEYKVSPEFLKALRQASGRQE